MSQRHITRVTSPCECSSTGPPWTACPCTVPHTGTGHFSMLSDESASCKLHNYYITNRRPLSRRPLSVQFAGSPLDEMAMRGPTYDAPKPAARVPMVRKIAKVDPDRWCHNCGAIASPQWRTLGGMTVCNACGIKSKRNPGVRFPTDPWTPVTVVHAAMHAVIQNVNGGRWVASRASAAPACASGLTSGRLSFMLLCML